VKPSHKYRATQCPNPSCSAGCQVPKPPLPSRRERDYLLLLELRLLVDTSYYLHHVGLKSETSHAQFSQNAVHLNHGVTENNNNNNKNRNKVMTSTLRWCRRSEHTHTRVGGEDLPPVSLAATAPRRALGSLSCLSPGPCRPCTVQTV